jgi:hypothetical protein
MKKTIRLGLLVSMLFALTCLYACEDSNTQVTDDTIDSLETDGSVGEDVADVPEGQCYTRSDELGIGVLVEGESNDGDAVCDSIESEEGYDGGPSCREVADCDGDGLSDAQEIFYNDATFNGTGYATNPSNPDTDDDGIIDSEDPRPIYSRVPCTPPDLPEIYEGRSFSYVSRVAIAPENCCRDLNDSIGPDNAIVSLEEAVQSAVDAFSDDEEPLYVPVNERLEEALELGDLAYVLEFDGLPKTLEDSDAATLQKETCGNDALEVTATQYEVDVTEGSIEDRRAGAGRYELLTELEEASGIGFESGEVLFSETGGLTIPSSAVLPLPELPGQVYSEPISFDLSGFALSVETTENAPAGQRGVRTEDTVETGGIMPASVVLETFNKAYQALLPEYDGELLSLEQASGDDDRLSFHCPESLTSAVEAETGLSDPEGQDLGADDVFRLPAFCSLVDSLYGSEIDVDTDDDGVADAFSLGLRIELSGAALTTDTTGDE